MSRIGRIPIDIPAGVKANIKDGIVYIEGPQGKLTRSIHSNISVVIQDGQILVKRKGDSPFEKSLHGLYQRLISNMVTGVTKGFQKNLEIVGVGYRAKVEGKVIVLQLGFSHPIKYTPPEGIKISVADNTKINVSGVDKQLVGEVAAEIRKHYPPEPYKGKGVRYVGEYVRRKVGKSAVGKGGTK